MFNKIFNLQKRTAVESLSLVYKAGMIPLLYGSYLNGYYLYLNNTYEQGFSFVQNRVRLYSEEPVSNMYLGIFGGMIFFIISVYIWKLVCELLLIMFRFFETNTK
jgi:hypothetical protein